MKLKRTDKVQVLAGRDRGKSGEVTRVIPADNKVVVDGINIAKRHTKPGGKNPRGGILEITRPIDAGKVALICPACKKPTRVGYEIKGKEKMRICRKCKASIK